MGKRLALALVLGSAFLLAAAGEILATQATPGAAATDPYSPGLGDFMTAYVQPHHVKLWLAGSTGNWKLAAYEADELGETFDDVTTYQRTWKNVPVAKLVKSLLVPALKKVDAAIASKNTADFKGAYEGLTAACNACHVAAKHEFLEIQVPTGNPYPDQNFTTH